MLKLENITKDYQLKGQESVHALRGVSVNFRRNEFVAILGPSGCGKTTLLNIIGGLDRYTSGNLFIEGRSTKSYKDRDWDAYRNHSIGFVFQAYNLIGHSSVLANVELALTISGISRKDRRERALKALETVGLKGKEKMKPNQLSGGQCQRVAIARALVNNPEILMADEPTGALDSETGIQIMDLLKEVAKDRLVIMVTHNPELAEKYATRIVNMFDGVITGDTNPYEGETVEERNKAIKKLKIDINDKKKKTSMSFPTAAGLSAKNLISKSKRTVLVSIAGSIGIVGVSAVLAMSQGIRDYITGMQDDMLSSYPITIQEESVDYSSLMSGLSDWSADEVIELAENEVGLNSMIAYLMDKYQDFTAVKTNDINADLVQFLNEMPEDYISSMCMNYGLDLTNNIFTTFYDDMEEKNSKVMSLNGLTQMYISELQTVEGFSEYAKFVNLFTGFMKLLPGDSDYILTQYDIMGSGHFPTNENEIMLVVDDDKTLTDVLLAQLGFYSHDEFLNIAQKAIKLNDEENPLTPEQIKALDDEFPYRSVFNVEDIYKRTFTYYPHDDIWEYGEFGMKMSIPGMGEFEVPAYHYSAEKKDTWEHGKQIKISGILKKKPEINFGCLSRGVYYNKALADVYMNDAENSDIINNETNGMKKYIGSAKEANSPFMAYTTYKYQDASKQDPKAELVNGYAYALNMDLSGSLSSMISISGDKVNYTDYDITFLRSMSGLAAKPLANDKGEATGEYSFERLPNSIKIYPLDFNNKDLVTDYLDQWNNGKVLTLKDGKTISADRNELTYTDSIEMIISVINTLITAITVALVCFTSLSLVVSCFMIAVITFISVVERVKEIGVIRSLGGRKKDVSRLFIAETFITGFTSGLIGIGITYVIEIILNICIYSSFSIANIANLTPLTALIMLAISIILSVISGLIPSLKASNQDPVLALRSE